MHPIDWIITIVPLIICGIDRALYAAMSRAWPILWRRAMRGAYLLCTARSEMGGSVLAVAGYEVFRRAVFTMSWWEIYGHFGSDNDDCRIT